jgi:putative methionine-R-sulfoxide reductase with GAF domain
VLDIDAVDLGTFTDADVTPLTRIVRLLEPLV